MGALFPLRPLIAMGTGAGRCAKRKIYMTTYDIRWIQRFNNFSKALAQLEKFIEKGELNKLEKQGLIQSFECTYELTWNTIKDYFESQGETNILGSRDAFRLAFKRGLIENGDVWMEMITSRALTSHTYNEETAEKIAQDIEAQYYDEFTRLHEKFAALKEKEA
jgi:nucleotidyltransferase substrate binding protein (TIGR01987 family)